MNRAGKTAIRRGGANRARRMRLESGVSLIEILVVLVILLVGIFLAVRVFPNGFGILKANSNRTLAAQFAQQQLSELKSDADNLPQGIVMSAVDPVTGKLIFATNVDADNLLPCSQIVDENKRPDVNDPYYNPCDDRPRAPEVGGKETTPVTNAYFSDVNKFRYVKGEGVKIPLPTVGAFGSGSLYAAKFGPLFMNQQVGDPEAVPDDASRDIFSSYLRVTSAPMTGINATAGDSNPNAFLRGPQTYVIDYGNSNDGTGGAQIYLPPRAPANPPRAIPYRIFSITLSYETGSGVATVQADSIKVMDTDLPGWRPITVNTNPIGAAVPGSETVTREFNRIPASQLDWDTLDPYQYKLLSPNVLTNQSTTGTDGAIPTYANVGIIAFNPAGANYSEEDASGRQQPFKAYLDYAVLDWHILRDNREVPSVIADKNGLIPVRTTLGQIQRAGGSGSSDFSTYNGLYGSKSDDIQVFNLSSSSGTALTAGKLTDGTPTPAANANGADFYINDDERGGTYRTGTIYINPNRVRVGSKLRILYKAEGDWAVSVQKAYAAYRQNYRPDNANLPALFPLKGKFDGFSLAGVGNQAQIRLPYADFNKSFLVTLQYTTKDGRVKRLASIQMTAREKDDAPAPGFNEKYYDDRWSLIKVADFLPLTAKSEFATATNWQVVGTITGVSVKSRVIWRDADSSEGRWRLQDMDAYMRAGQ